MKSILFALFTALSLSTATFATHIIGATFDDDTQQILIQVQWYPDSEICDFTLQSEGIVCLASYPGQCSTTLTDSNTNHQDIPDVDVKTLRFDAPILGGPAYLDISDDSGHTATVFVPFYE